MPRYRVKHSMIGTGHTRGQIVELDARMGERLVALDAVELAEESSSVSAPDVTPLLPLPMPPTTGVSESAAPSRSASKNRE